jgi:probable rRNA maturation factor
VPAPASFRRWAQAALAARREGAEVTVRVVGREESAALNQRYRGKAGPTNVLSFPWEGPAGIEAAYLGDLVICAPVVQSEAGAQAKAPAAHWAHLVVHGILHLLGFDHDQPAAAAEMERVETEVLGRLGVPDPYNDTDSP